MFLSNCCIGQTVHKSVLCNVVSSGTPGHETSAKFAVAVPGSQVSGLSVVPSEGNRRVFILLDSGGGNGKSNGSLSLAMQIVKDFIAGSPPEEQFALVDFADKVYFDIPFQSADRFAKQFANPNVTGKIKALGPTVLFDAISNAADYLHNSAAEGDSIFVISEDRKSVV